MAYVTLAEAKKHLQVDAFFTDDDTYITALIDAAEGFVERSICHPLADYAPVGVLAAPLRQAVLLMVGNFYANREPVAFGVGTHEIPFTVKSLIHLYRDFAG